jgi:tRNA 2-thiouridine synthesizing protein A
MSTYFIDITKEHCPMTFVKVKLKLEELANGDILRVLLTAGEPLENVPRTVTEAGYKVMDILPEDDNFIVVIKK